MFDQPSLRRMIEKCGWQLIYCRSWSKMKYNVNPTPLQRWFHGVLEERNLTDYITFVARNPA
jgi:hypothetical protein